LYSFKVLHILPFHMGIVSAAIKGRVKPLIFLIALMLGAPVAHAQEPPGLELLNGEYKYRIAWNGIKIGRVNFYFEENDTTYRVIVDTKTSGVLRLFHPLQSITTGNGRKADGRYIPEFYHANSNSEEGKGRVAKLHFNEEGLLKKRDVTPPEDPLWRPEVPLEELAGAVDPVTIFFVMRQEIARNLTYNIKTTSARVYDGRRLAEISVRAINAGTRLMDDAVVPMLNTIITRQPMNGYTPKEMKKFEDGDPVLHLYFSRDKRFMPIAAETYLRFGTISATLENNQH
jgi:hypothetical protein